ncbi:MAG: DNA polymerase/3'-5' exonuclease PolX [Chloroflexota bacterium]|nr:DNA polymerase/3'-5' exonuclease PolX [Chloroflexota bacterium]
MPDRPALTNNQIASRFQQLADLLEIQGEAVFKVVAYRRAAESLAQWPERLAMTRERGALGSIPGVGKAIEQKVEDLLDTGTFKLWEEVTRETPLGVAELLQVPDVGPKRARQLYSELGIDSLESLRRAVERGQLAGLRGLGPRGAQKIVDGLRSLQPSDHRLPLGQARTVALTLIEHLRNGLPDLLEVAVAGSTRRMRDTVGDLNLVLSHERMAEVQAALERLPTVDHVALQRDSYAAATLQNGVRVTVAVASPEQFGAVLHHWTGSVLYNQRLAEVARERGYALGPLGLSAPRSSPACPTEMELYDLLGLQLVPATMREEPDMVDRALAGNVPEEIEVGMLRGDLHTHTTWSDGQRTVREMAEAARALGYEYLCVTDHSQSLGVANGLSPLRLAQQRLEIDAVNAELAPFRVLQGVELEVRGDGSLDLPDETLAALDIVVASVHTGLRQGRERVTSRALAAVRHPLVDVLAHPTGRLVGRRAGGDFDMEALIAEALRTGTALEINSDPARLDLRDVDARPAAEAGCLLSIDSDAHSTEGLGNVFYGAALASRARVRQEQVLNTLPLNAMLSTLKRNRRE